jgi:flagellar motility protein MotE (MotC chaperone)
MAKKAKAVKKKRGKAVFFGVAILFTIGLLVLIFGYIDFEFKKIGETGVTPLSDWRSYLSFLLSKVPFVKNYVKYEPRQIIKPSAYYTEIYESYIEKIEKDRKELEEKHTLLGEKEVKLNSQEFQIKARTEELNLVEERLLSEKTQWEDQKQKFEQLADWYENSDTGQIALALSSYQISIEEIVSGLRLVDSGIAAEIIGELAALNPDKAAMILSYLAGKEVIK